jgi:hypothetical protein
VGASSNIVPVKFREKTGTGKNTGASAAGAILPVPGIMPEYRPVIKYRLKTGRQRPVQFAGNNNKDILYSQKQRAASRALTSWCAVHYVPLPPPQHRL